MQLPIPPSHEHLTEATHTSHFPRQPSSTITGQTVELNVTELGDTSGSGYDTDTSSNLTPPPPYIEEAEEPQDMARLSSRRHATTSTRNSRQIRRREHSQHQDGNIPETPDHFINSGNEITSQQPTQAILILGATGAGKSSFIASATGLKVDIGHTIDPCTVDPRSWTYTHKDDPDIILIDTPGFNDQKRKDTDLLGSIVDYISRHRYKIIGLIYLQRITERKLTSSTTLNLRLLRAICGRKYFQNIVLATSMWNTIPASEIDELITREVQFNTSPAFWADVLQEGAEYCRWDDTGSVKNGITARAITQLCTNKRHPASLDILLDIERGVQLEDTAAYRVLSEELRKQLERERKALVEEEQRVFDLQSQQAELQRRVGLEEEGVRQDSEALERAKNAAGEPNLINSLASLSFPRQRRFSEAETPAGVRLLDARREERHDTDEDWERSQSDRGRREARSSRSGRDEDSYESLHLRRKHRSLRQFVYGWTLDSRRR